MSVTEAIDTSTPAAKMLFRVLGAIAELERSIIRERVIRVRKRPGSAESASADRMWPSP